MGRASRKKQEARRAAEAAGTKRSASRSRRGSGGGSGGAAASPAVLGGGAVLLAVAAGASFVLVLQKLADAALPGCGPESACAKAQSSVWGSVPGLGWSTANVGLAWFLGLLAAWLVTRGRLPGPVRALAAVGAAGSLLLGGVMLVEGYLCPYCLAAHVANLGFVGLVLARPSGGTATFAPGLVTGAAAFAIATGGLAVAETRHREQLDEQAKADLDASVGEVLDRAGAARATEAALEADAELQEQGVFTGRYRRGPEQAPIRLVVFSDYQCPDCKRVEGEIEEILGERDDVSFHAKHFPMDGTCNDMVRERMGRGPHPNACWAARAAEAAGILGGDEAFYRMHEWLFSVNGSFTNETLPDALREMGFDPQGFIAVMMGDETERRVQRDIEEALDLGLHFTPMVFINGVEVKGWTRRGAVREAVERLAEADLPALTAAEAGDRPPRALRKYLEDWQDSRRRPLPPDNVAWWLEPRDGAEAELDVMVWADLESPSYLRFARSMMRVLRSEPGVRMSVRHYPLSSECNPMAESERFRTSCLAARAVEAAGRLGGAEAWWAMHDELVKDGPPYRTSQVVQRAIAIGLDPDAFEAAMDDPQGSAAIAEDSRAGRSTGLRGIPWVFVDGRRAPRVNFEGEDFPRLLIETALEEQRGDGTE